MKKLPILTGIVTALMLGGCATVDEQVITLQNENAGLKQDLQAKTAQIEVLSAEKIRLASELEYSNKRATVLSKEKSARQDEAAELRKGIREFAEAMQKTLQTYFQRTEIVDYVGSELIARANVDSDQKTTLLADMSNPIPSGGTLIGGRAWISAPTSLNFCLLRLNPESGKYTIVSMTPAISANQTGLQTWLFDIPMAARRGDIVGVYFADAVTIPYDAVDTGEVVAIPGPAKVGMSVSIVAGDARNKRSYSFGVVGYLEAPAATSRSDAGAASSEAPVSGGAN